MSQAHKPADTPAIIDGSDKMNEDFFHRDTILGIVNIRLASESVLEVQFSGTTALQALDLSRTAINAKTK
ncbi:uncharacterized protein RAG0_12416 [Rhynchosporium agropyri]|uniref:Uncharacterized protein n=1 Tax=Rhynchosporium agropyri TaxID=914238 RepID=A0A1E1LAQ5_9HELO|nr:uncharacterized protein RAG0_12416 [Rhynchosporium agropyri]